MRLDTGLLLLQGIVMILTIEFCKVTFELTDNSNDYQEKRRRGLACS